LAVAAGLILVGSVTLVLLTPTEVMAQPAEMAQMYRQMVAENVGAGGGMKFTDMGQINAEIQRQWSDFPGLRGAGSNAGFRAHECCVSKMKTASVAFILLDVEGKHVSLAIAKSSEVASPKAATVQHGQSIYTLQQVGELNMVMMERGGRWICLTGDMGSEKLMEIGDQLVKD